VDWGWLTGVANSDGLCVWLVTLGKSEGVGCVWLVVCPNRDDEVCV
jgi:hypothetical protein